MNTKQWLDELFEYEDCAECGKGTENHEVMEFLGNPFAKCIEGAE